MTDSPIWMKVIDDLIWMKRDILDAASMQRRGRQRRRPAHSFRRITFLPHFFPLSQMASKFVGQVEISYLHRSVKIHGPLVLNYYLQNAVVNSCT